MNSIGKLLVGATGIAAIGGLAAPAAAQNYPYYPQQNYPQQTYPQQGYPQQAYPQGYAQPQQGGIVGIINQLLGGRNTSQMERAAVSQCALAAQTQAARQIRPAYGRYNQGYNQGYNPYAAQMPPAQVTAITSVERRNNGVRVSGLMSSGMVQAYAQQGYNQGYAQQGYDPRYPQGYDPRYQQGYDPRYQQGYGRANVHASSDLTFRCNVDYRGAVTNVRLGRNSAFRR